MEKEINFLKQQIFELKELISASQSYSEGVQSDLWDSEAKQKEKNRDLSNSTNNVQNNLFNYEFSNDEHIKNIDKALASVDELAIELYESGIAQEEINDAQDEAIIELYELLEQ